MASFIELELAKKAINAIERIAGALENLASEWKRGNDIASKVADQTRVILETQTGKGFES